MKNKKIVFSSLNVQITRRCNMACAHCMRGEAQNVDISNEVIDKLLDKTKSISVLNFSSGGEPLLNISGMRYFLNSMIDRNIPLYSMQIVTNGTIRSQDFINLLNEYHEYISKYTGYNTITVSVSLDKYHEQYTNSLENYRWYKNNLPSFCSVFTKTNIIMKEGRSSNLREAFNIYDQRNVKVAYYSKDENDFPCTYMECFADLADDEIVLPCLLNLNYDGSITADNMSYDHFDDPSSIIFTCDTNIEDIIKFIKLYNIGKPYCKCVRYGYFLTHLSEKEKAASQLKEEIQDGEEIFNIIDGLNYTEGRTFSTIETLVKQWKASNTLEKAHACDPEGVSTDILKKVQEVDQFVNAGNIIRGIGEWIFLPL